MALTPVEIRHVKFTKTPIGGYQRAAVDRLVEEIVDSFEDVWRDRADLADKVEHLEQELVRYRELEALLRTTLVSAERASQELKEQARREAEIVLNEAHAEARSITTRARAEREHLASEARRIRSLLRAALDSLDVPEEDGEEEREAAEEKREAA
jgi:cell division initiation protein